MILSISLVNFKYSFTLSNQLVYEKGGEEMTGEIDLDPRAISWP